MWGNIFSGAMSIAQGDSPEEILKKQAMATVTGGMTGGAPVPGAESVGTFAPHLAQTGIEQGASNLAEQGFMGSMGDALGGFGDTLSEYGGNINEFTGMESRDWTQLAIGEGLGAMEGTPNQMLATAPGMVSQGNPSALKNAGGLLDSHTKPNSPQGLDPNVLRQLQMRGLV